MNISRQSSCYFFLLLWNREAVLATQPSPQTFKQYCHTPSRWNEVHTLVAFSLWDSLSCASWGIFYEDGTTAEWGGKLGSRFYSEPLA